MALLRLQNEKLDLLVKRTASMSAQNKRGAKRHSGTRAAISRPKTPLPLLLNSTGPFFCIKTIDAGARRIGHHISDGPQTPQVNAPPATRTSVSIVQGEIIESESNYITQSDSDDVADLRLDESLGSANHSLLASAYPLNELDVNYVSQVVQIYGSLEGITYPVVDITDLTQKARCLFDGMAGFHSARCRDNMFCPGVDKNDLAQLKLVVAIVLLSDGNGGNRMAGRLFQSLRQDIEELMWNAEVDLNDLIVMTLVVSFNPVSDSKGQN